MTKLVTISSARTELPSLVRRVNRNLDRYIITVQGEPKAAFLSLEELESLEETAEVLSIPHAKESISRGMAQAKKTNLSPARNFWGI